MTGEVLSDGIWSIVIEDGGDNKIMYLFNHAMFVRVHGIILCIIIRHKSSK